MVNSSIQLLVVPGLGKSFTALNPVPFVITKYNLFSHLNLQEKYPFMARLIIKSIVLMLAISTPFCVVASEFHLPEFYDSVTFHWQHADTQVSPDKYKQTSRHNKRLLRRAIKDYLATNFTSLGVPRSALMLSEIVVFLAIGQDAKFNLNDNKTMALELKDLNDEDRAILYELKFSW